MVTENDIQCQSHARQDQQIMRKRGAKTVKTESINSRNGQDRTFSATSGETLMEASASTSFGCLLCGTEQSNSLKRTNLKGKLRYR